MDEKKVKGTMLVDQVRMIRAHKQLDWNRFLGPKDWEVINQRILPSNWYPLEVYENCGWATFNVLGEGNLDLVRLRGRIRGKELFETTYKSFTIGNDPMRALDMFVRSYSLLFNFSSLSFEQIADMHAWVHHEYSSRKQTTIPYCHQLLGHFESLVEMTGGSNVKIEFVNKAWEGDPKTIFDIQWE